MVQGMARSLRLLGRPFEASCKRRPREMVVTALAGQNPAYAFAIRRAAGAARHFFGLQAWPHQGPTPDGERV